MLTADPAAQRALLDLADVDRAHAAAIVRRDGLPEHATIAENSTKIDAQRAEAILAEAGVADIDSATRKLDTEIDGVRARTKRDEDLLASGAVSAKETENLQRELESLSRRQNTLEDDALELMQQSEDAAALLTKLETDIAGREAELVAATETRDAALSDIERQLTDLTSDRAGLIAQIPEATLAIYHRLRTRGQIGAARLTGPTCGACQMMLDRSSLDEITAAPADVVPTCSECGALLIRST